MFFSQAADDREAARQEELDRRLYPDGYEDPDDGFDPDNATQAELDEITNMLNQQAPPEDDGFDPDTATLEEWAEAKAMQCQDDSPEEYPPEVLERMDKDPNYAYDPSKPIAKSFFDLHPGISTTVNSPEPKREEIAPQRTPLVRASLPGPSSQTRYSPPTMGSTTGQLGGIIRSPQAEVPPRKLRPGQSPLSGHYIQPQNAGSGVMAAQASNGIRSPQTETQPQSVPSRQASPPTTAQVQNTATGMSGTAGQPESIRSPQAEPANVAPPVKPPKSKKNDMPTPYSVAQALLQTEKLIVSGNAVHRYNEKYYQFCTAEDVKRFIIGRCRVAVELAGNANFVEQVYKCLTLEPSICTDAPLQASPDYIVLQDIVLDLRANERIQHSSDIFATSMLQAEYYPGLFENHPNFDKFLMRITQGDPDLIEHIWTVLGVILTQDLRGKNFFVFQGPTDSGKSVLGHLIQNCCHPSSICSLDLHSFNKNFALSSLIGKRLCIDLDLSSGAISPNSASIVKKLTGGDLLSADIKYMPRVNFVNSAQLVFATNHAVYTQKADPAFNRRCVIVPFTQTIPRSEQDPQLLQKLLSERDGIIGTALLHYQEHRRNNYIFKQNYMANATVQGNEDLDNMIIQFLHLHCHVNKGVWTPTHEFYLGFIAKFGMVCKEKTFSAIFGRIMRHIHPDVQCNVRKRIAGNSNPIYGYEGITLNPQGGEPHVL